MDPRNFQVTIGGQAGQGLVTLGGALARALVRSGYHIAVTQSYMSRVRGGHNTFAIRAGTSYVGAPQEAIDLLIALNDETAELHRAAVAQADGVVILSSASAIAAGRSLRVPYKELADSRHEDMIALGVAAALLGLDLSLVSGIVSSRFQTKDAASARVNSAAVTAGYEWGKQAPPALTVSLPPVRAADMRLMLNGNEALALGALAAGVRFCAFYPMSPSTSVVLELAKRADVMGVVVEQAEDEIAAINMALGAAYAGGRSMTATSGGGFALMAAATEIPVVIVVAQRPGPATGLPTRTEQSDLEFVLHAGHGEFPRALLTPGTVEACFELMRRAFTLAEASQSPVFVMTDQFLADSYRDVLPFDLIEPPLRSPPVPEPVRDPYRSYALTASGVSPRLVPCASGHLVVADSHEHAESGHITEEPALRTQMVDKRLRKLDVLSANVAPPEYAGSDAPELLLVSWGSSKGAVAEAAARLNAEGQDVATLHFDQVWPLVPSQFLGRLQAARHTVCVEGNATRQFARLLRRESGFLIGRSVCRYDGRPFTSEYIVERLSHEL